MPHRPAATVVVGGARRCRSRGRGAPAARRRRRARRARSAASARAAAACRSRARASSAGTTDGVAAGLELAEDLREEPRGLARAVLRREVRPHRGKRLARDRGAAPAAPAARPAASARARAGSAGSRSSARRSGAADARSACRRGPTIVTVVAPTRAGQIEARPATRHRVVRALDPHQRSRRDRRKVAASATNGASTGAQRRAALRRSARRSSRSVHRAPRVDARVEPREQRLVDRRRGVGPLGIGTSACRRIALPRASTPPLSWPSPADRSTARTDSARRAPRSAASAPLAADEDPRDRRPQIVVRDPRRHAAEVRKGAHVAVEKADLILPLVDPGEVAARVHQPHQKEPRLRRTPATSTSTSKKSTSARSPGAIRQRHEDLPPLPLPLRDCRLHQRGADPMALGPQQLVQPRRRQPLLAARPVRRLRQQRLDPRADGRPTPAAVAAASPAAPAPPASRYFRTVIREIPNSRATAAATGPRPTPCDGRHVPDPP